MEAKKLGQARAKLVRRSELLVFSWEDSPNYIWWFIRMARLKTDKVWYNTSCTIIFILSTFCYSRLRRRLSLNFNFTCLLRSVHYKSHLETMRPMKTYLVKKLIWFYQDGLNSVAMWEDLFGLYLPVKDSLNESISNTLTQVSWYITVLLRIHLYLLKKKFPHLEQAIWTAQSSKICQQWYSDAWMLVTYGLLELALTFPYAIRHFVF